MTAYKWVNARTSPRAKKLAQALHVLGEAAQSERSGFRKLSAHLLPPKSYFLLKGPVVILNLRASELLELAGGPIVGWRVQMILSNLQFSYLQISSPVDF